MKPLKELTNQIPLPPRVRDSIKALNQLKINWKNLLGEFSYQCSPQKIENDFLYIQVYDPYILQQLLSQYLTIFEKCKNLLSPILALKGLKFVHSPCPTNFSPPKKIISINLSSSEINQLKKMCQNLPQQDLGECFLKLFKNLEKRYIES